MPTLTISSRYCGPTHSVNGGYACGSIAAYADGPVTVKLRQPPPLEVPMTVERDGDGSLRVSRNGTLIAEATVSPGQPGEPGQPTLPMPSPIAMDEIRAVATRARYFDDPYFPDCFVCGVNREPGDGLRIFPGPMPGQPGQPGQPGRPDRSIWAAPWTPAPSVAGPDGTVRPEVIWAALDCPSGIAAGEGSDLDQDTAIVLGQMTASLPVRPAAGDRCQVIAWPAGRDGRKLTAGSALLGPGGEVLAAATAIWITVPRPVTAASAQ
jgi:hypothetical protein